ncbi:MAG: DUF4783 domain-containing protein [Bacteroidia bacterium]
MKNRGVSFFLAVSCLVHAQKTEDFLQKVEDAIRKGDAQALAQYFLPNVELILPSTQKDYQKTQAYYVMKEFFQKHPPRGFQIIHRGRSDGMIYAVGTYITYTEKMDVNIFIRPQEKGLRIERLRFEIL